MRKLLFIFIPLLIVVIVVPIGSLFFMKSLNTSNTSILAQIGSKSNLTILQSKITPSLFNTQAELTLKLSDEGKKLAQQSDAIKGNDELLALLDEPILLNITLSNNPLSKNWLNGTAQAGDKLSKYLGKKPLAEFYIPMEFKSLKQKNATLYAKLNDMIDIPLLSNTKISFQDSNLTLSILDAKPQDISFNTRIHQTQMKDLPSDFALSFTMQGENFKSASIKVPKIQSDETLDFNDVEIGISTTKPVAIAPVKDMILKQMSVPETNALAGMVALLEHVQLLGDNTYTVTFHAKEIQGGDLSVGNISIVSNASIFGARADSTSTVSIGSVKEFGVKKNYQDVKFNVDLGINDFASFIKMNDEIGASKYADRDKKDKMLARLFKNHFFIDKINFSMQSSISNKYMDIKNFTFEGNNKLADNTLSVKYSIGVDKLTTNDEALDNGKNFSISNGKAELSLSLDNFQSILHTLSSRLSNPEKFDERFAGLRNNLFNLKNLSLNANADMDIEGVKLKGVSIANSYTLSANDVTLNINAGVDDISGEKLDDLKLKFGGAKIGLEVSNVSNVP